MPELPVRSSDGGDSEAKRRKVRKGTKSCWECRKRKIRCLYPSEDAPTCAGCDARGATCVSQEFADELPPAPDRRLTQRLGRVEDLLERLVEKIMPDSYTPERRAVGSSSSVSVEDEIDPTGGACPFSAGRPPVRRMLESLRGSPAVAAAPCPYENDTPALSAKHAQVAKTLHALFPCQQDTDAITSASVGPYFVVMFVASHRDRAEGRTEPASSVSEIPSATSHPALLAKRLMQLTNCMQQLPPSSFLRLTSKESVRAMMVKYASTVSDLVASDDDLVGSVEGLEALTLLMLYHTNSGNLRKAWLAVRRTLSVAQLMGADRWGDEPLKSVDPKSDPSTRAKAKMLWFVINFSDRYLSLLLGLPAGTDDNSFADDDPHDSPMERLEKKHAVLAHALIKRNSNMKSDSSFSTTQTIDCDLEQAWRSMGPSFWQPVQLDTTASPVERHQVMSHLLMQLNHHNLLILLHLPYMMRDPKERRWDYSKTTCMSSSRELLRSFLLFRRLNDASFICRHTDYGALTAGLTLLLGYLDPKLHERDENSIRARQADQKLVQDTQFELRDMAEKNKDKLSFQSSDLISRLLPLADTDRMSRYGADGADVPVRLDIPYLGTINIKKRLHSSLDENPPPAAETPAPVVMPDFQGFPTPYSNVNETDTADISYMTHDNNLFSSFDETDFAPMQFEFTSDQLRYPELAADAEQWTFQGFDTTYFESLFPGMFVDNQGA
ncbi:Uu.00g101800.m01.CDS01 [Anthostomella pinea]|uniref:Uu.00g101800.m01.CDS01 n=1 Tax=Anthostomella pinea TaxID=933095 RepID=A0AAI8YFF8_9PEZI|nr:Uu.00g101800.m01.CDS01 [Anthostomella pinea]